MTAPHNPPAKLEKGAEREQIMAAYRDAYFVVYGRKVQIDYWRGWYSVFSGVTQDKYREREILNMTTRLLGRTGDAS